MVSISGFFGPNLDLSAYSVPMNIAYTLLTVAVVFNSLAVWRLQRRVEELLDRAWIEEPKSDPDLEGFVVDVEGHSTDDPMVLT